jgi:hypothetical protein
VTFNDVINIVSTQPGSSTLRGPYKVYRNLVKGLEAIGYPYVVNGALNSTRRLWVHDDPVALRYASQSGAKTVVGPNLYVLPCDIPPVIDLKGCLYIQPSEWAASVWRTAGFTECALVTWPVGIDLEEFRPAAGRAQRDTVMVYHKLRSEQELARILASLDRASLRYRLFRYGSYHEADYRSCLGEASLVVWHGCHESQGIALQEALAMDVPVLLCDVSRLSEAEGPGFPPELDALRVTAAPYFDPSCGWRTYDLDVGSMARHMLRQRWMFAPRAYVQANLSLEGQARRFVSLWEHFGLSVDDGYSEGRISCGEWREPLGVRAARHRARVMVGMRRRMSRALAFPKKRRMR